MEGGRAELPGESQEAPNTLALKGLYVFTVYSPEGSA